MRPSALAQEQEGSTLHLLRGTHSLTHRGRSVRGRGRSRRGRRGAGNARGRCAPGGPAGPAAATPSPSSASPPSRRCLCACATQPRNSALRLPGLVAEKKGRVHCTRGRSQFALGRGRALEGVSQQVGVAPGRGGGVEILHAHFTWE